MKKDTKYPTIRQAAALGPLSESYLRLLQKQRKLPGFYVGRHFRINYELLIAQLNAKSLESMDGGTQR